MPPIVPDAPALVADDVKKSFVLPHEKVHTLKERALHPMRRTRNDVLRALNGVSFSVEHGEFFGVVGRNGSGKSTLLKCLAGIYRVDGGAVYVNGRVSTFIELGVGFNMELAAHDNVVLNAVMLGVSRAQAEARYERILEFSELREFEDLKLKNYSSGMLVRLAFSVMIQVDADILLIDEVLAVGDASFQQKCFDEFRRLREEGRTVLLVTHDMSSVQRFCDRALLLERGEVRMIDTAEKVANQYFSLNFNRPQAEAPEAEPEEDRPIVGDGTARILEGWFESADGERVNGLTHGDTCTFCARVRFTDTVVDPHIGVTIADEQERVVFAASTVREPTPTGSFAAEQTVTIRLAFDVWFAPGRYRAALSLAHDPVGQDVIDHQGDVASLIVSNTRPAGGMVDLPHRLSIERADIAGAASVELR